MKRIACALALLAAPAMAQDAPVETVTAHGSSLVGVWRVGEPDFVAVSGMFSAPKFGPPRQTYCRIAPMNGDLAVLCNDPARVATMTVQDGHIHVAWGTMMLRFVLDGEIQSAQAFQGHFKIKVAGITFENPTVTEAVRVTPEANAPDSAGKADLVRRILEQGLAAVPHDSTRWRDGFPAQPPLGPISAIAYVGQESVALAADKEGFPPFKVYLVTFDHAERLCFLHQREDGVPDAFRCA